MFWLIKWLVINLTINELNYHYLHFDLGHMASICYIFENDVTLYVIKIKKTYQHFICNHMFIMYTYIIHIIIYKMHIKDLLEFEPKTLCNHANVFTIKLHNLLFIKNLQLYLIFNLWNHGRNPKIDITFLFQILFKWNK